MWSAAIERGRAPLHSDEVSGEWDQDIEGSGGGSHDSLREDAAQQPQDKQGGARSRGGGGMSMAGGRGSRGEGMAGLEVATGESDDMRQGLL